VLVPDSIRVPAIGSKSAIDEINSVTAIRSSALETVESIISDES